MDVGVDIIATFSLADTFSVRLGVQAKHFRPDPPVGAAVVDQLAAGMEAEQITLGWVATSGSFSNEATERKTKLEEERGISIELVDGEQLAAMIVEGGLRAVGYSAQRSRDWTDIEVGRRHPSMPGCSAPSVSGSCANATAGRRVTTGDTGTWRGSQHLITLSC